MTPDLPSMARKQASQMNVLPEHTIMVAMADEIERLQQEIEALRCDLEGTMHNRFYDQRDAYFEGIKDGR